MTVETILVDLGKAVVVFGAFAVLFIITRGMTRRADDRRKPRPNKRRSVK